MFTKLKTYLLNLKDKYFSIESDKCILSDKKYVERYYEKRLGVKPDLKKPKLFSEKLNWLKIYYRDPLMTICADKYKMREYVKMCLGEGYTVPLLGKWDNPEDIDFDALPNKFVLKTNHDGCPIMCYDKSKFDIEGAKKLLFKKLNSDYYKRGREWAYKNIKRVIFAEEFIDCGEEELIDYKFFCFNGEPKFLYTLSEKTNEKSGKLTYFDMDFNVLPFKRQGKQLPNVIPNKPENFYNMVEVAKKLSCHNCEAFPFVRVDLYSVKNKIYVGELTFYPTNGMHVLEPYEYNQIIGDYLELPSKHGFKKHKGTYNKWIKQILKS